MKTLEEIIKQKPVYLDEFTDKRSVITEFEDGYYFNDEVPDDVLARYDDINILFAYYSYENYEGTAFVLFERDGKLFEVNGGHCSCYGLENQWDEEEVLLEAMQHRLTEGYFASGFKRELCEFFGVEYDTDKEYEVYY